MNNLPFIPGQSPFSGRYDTHVANPHVVRNAYLKVPAEETQLPTFPASRALLPEPYWDGHPATIACYWRAWELAFGNLKRPTPENGFCSNYIDTAFNGNLFLWDSAFITAYGIYGRRAFPFQRTLDNFYRKQHPDGFICREISETDGGDCFQRFDPTSTGPNVLAWAEWNHFLQTGDRVRLEAVFDPLAAYHEWTRAYRSWPDGSYWTTGWGCGMDDLPRLGPGEHTSWSHGRLVWVDATFQALLSARILARIADLLGRQTEKLDLSREADALADYCNRFLWSEEIQFYCDRFPEGHLSLVKHIGAYWSLLAGCVPLERLPGLLAHLDNPHEFKRIHRVPALSADHPAFAGLGNYWCGGVWAPTNYMVLKGLDAVRQEELAHAIAINHLENVVQVYTADDLHWEGAEQFRQYFHLASLEYDDQHTLWENYAPDFVRPGSHSKPGYVGWSGLPPIAVLFEDVFGIQADALANRLTWHVRLLEEHGIARYPFGEKGRLDLRCRSRRDRTERPCVEIHANIPVTVEVIWKGGKDIREINAE